jgi:hypothetical protein
MAGRKKKPLDIPIIHVPKGATLKQIYAQIKRDFTAADLQKFTEIEPMVPFGEVVAEMERIHERETRRLEQKQPTSKRKKQ